MKLFLFKLYKFLPVKVRFLISYLHANKFIIGMVAFVMKNKKILLIKHSYQHDWALPGGWMKHGESIESTMERELKEELGIAATVMNIFEIQSVKHKPVIDVAVVCRVSEDKLKSHSSEVEEALFFPIDSLPKNIVHTHKAYLEKFLEQPNKL